MNQLPLHTIALAKLADEKKRAVRPAGRTRIPGGVDEQADVFESLVISEAVERFVYKFVQIHHLNLAFTLADARCQCLRKNDRRLSPGAIRRSSDESRNGRATSFPEHERNEQ